MRFNVIFKKQNPAYNKEYANEFQYGEESENNQKTLYSTTYGLKDEVFDFEIIRNGNFELNGLYQNGETLKEVFTNMFLVKCFNSNEVNIATFGVSNKLIDRTLKAYDKKRNITRFYYYLKPDGSFTELCKGILVSNKDIPKTMVEKKQVK